MSHKRRHARRRPPSQRCVGCNAPVVLGRKTRHAKGCALDFAKPPFALLACPDCAAPFNGATFDHEECCPYLAAQDVTSDNDRQWFEDHPGETTRTRPPFQSEQMENTHVNTEQPGSWVTHVTVKQVEPGVRVRQMHTAMFVVIQP